MTVTSDRPYREVDVAKFQAKFYEFALKSCRKEPKR